MSAPGPAPALPAADLFLGLAGVLLVALALVAGDLGALVARARGAAPLGLHAAADALAREGGRLVLLAEAGGVRASGPGGELGVAARDDLPGAVVPPGWLTAAPGVPMVILARDAGDSAFLLEAALARSGVARVARLRLGCDAPVAVPGGLACAP